jgi:UDP-N-acetylenolpyruvoylglucosamine reductase
MYQENSFNLSIPRYIADMIAKYTSLMCKSEVQTFVSLILSRSQVIHLLLLGHSSPLLVTASITPDIVCLSQKVNENIGNHQGHKHTVSSLVPWCIIYFRLASTHIKVLGKGKIPAL